MAKYLLLKHYRGAPEAVNDVPMDQWTPEEVEDHMQFMSDFAARLEGTGEFVDSQALSPEGTFVRYDGEGRPPVTDGPFAETKDLIAGWMVIDVDTYERALELAGELSAAPGAGGKPIHEWLEVRPFLTRTDGHRVTGPAGWIEDGRTAAAGADARGDRRPRPSRSRLRDGRGRRAGGTHPGRADLAGPAARRPEGLAGHGGLAQVPRRPPLRGLASRPGAAGRGRAAARTDRDRRRHVAAVLPVRPSVADPGVRGGPHAARRRWLDHPADRPGLPRAGGDDGAADQPGQTHGR